MTVQVFQPVPATLCGYLVGGVIGYLLNRRHTFASDRPHAEAGWRFALVTFVGFWIHVYSVGYMAHDPGRRRGRNESTRPYRRRKRWTSRT